jgi:hypothetical protein
LNVELQFARLAFDRSQDAAEAQREYQRAIESGDTVKMRAFAEVFSGARNKFPHELESNRLAVAASHQLEALTRSDDLINAESRGAEVTQLVAELQTEIGAIAQELGVSGDVYKELNRVHPQRAYDQESGRWNTWITIDERPPQTVALPDQRQTYDRINPELKSNVRTA